MFSVSRLFCSRINAKVDRSDINLSGKSKHGAQYLRPCDLLCNITCSDGTVHPVYACARGKLLEVNEKLKISPHVLTSDPERSGFVAIILPNNKGEFEQAISRYDMSVQKSGFVH